MVAITDVTSWTDSMISVSLIMTLKDTLYVEFVMITYNATVRSVSMQ